MSGIPWAEEVVPEILIQRVHTTSVGFPVGTHLLPCTLLYATGDGVHCMWCMSDAVVVHLDTLRVSPLIVHSFSSTFVRYKHVFFCVCVCVCVPVMALTYIEVPAVIEMWTWNKRSCTSTVLSDWFQTGRCILFSCWKICTFITRDFLKIQGR